MSGRPRYYGDAHMLKRWVVSAPGGTIRNWITLVTVVSRLGATRPTQAKMLLVGLFAPLRDRLVGTRESRFLLRYGRLELAWVVESKSDFQVLNEILVQRIYEFGLPKSAPSVILDLGAHMGTSVLFFRERFPDARIVALEPDPRTFERLRQNVGRLPAVELRRKAVTPEPGSVEFFPAPQSWASSLNGAGHTCPSRDARSRHYLPSSGQSTCSRSTSRGPSERCSRPRRSKP